MGSNFHIGCSIASDNLGHASSSKKQKKHLTRKKDHRYRHGEPRGCQNTRTGPRRASCPHRTTREPVALVGLSQQRLLWNLSLRYKGLTLRFKSTPSSSSWIAMTRTSSAMEDGCTKLTSTRGSMVSCSRASMPTAIPLMLSTANRLQTFISKTLTW